MNQLVVIITYFIQRQRKGLHQILCENIMKKNTITVLLLLLELQLAAHHKFEALSFRELNDKLPYTIITR